MSRTMCSSLGRWAAAPGLSTPMAVAVMKNGAGPTAMMRTELDALPVAEKTGLPFASTVVAKNAAGQTIEAPAGFRYYRDDLPSKFSRGLRQKTALLLGLIAALAEAIPLVGPALGAVPALIVAAVLIVIGLAVWLIFVTVPPPTFKRFVDIDSYHVSIILKVASDSSYQNLAATFTEETGRFGINDTAAPNKIIPVKSPKKIGARRKSRLTPFGAPNTSLTA